MNRQEENKALIHWQLCPKAPLFPVDYFAYYKHSFPKIHYSSIQQAVTLLWAPPSPTQFVKTLPFQAWLQRVPAKKPPASQPLLSVQSPPPFFSILPYIKKKYNPKQPSSKNPSSWFWWVRETLGTGVVTPPIIKMAWCILPGFSTFFWLCQTWAALVKNFPCWTSAARFIDFSAKTQFA